MNINLFIANASGSLSGKLEIINRAFNKAVEITVNKINASDIDIIVLDAPDNTIKELGIGGYTPNANLIYISLDPAKEITEIDLVSGMVHEIHHAIRWRKPGYGNTLKEALITEGLATLFEEESTSIKPIYAKVKITQKAKALAESSMDDTNYNHQDWFIIGNKIIPKWFGYSYGYRIVKNYAQKANKRASDLVSIQIN